MTRSIWVMIGPSPASPDPAIRRRCPGVNSIVQWPGAARERNPGRQFVHRHEDAHSVGLKVATWSFMRRFCPGVNSIMQASSE